MASAIASSAAPTRASCTPSATATRTAASARATSAASGSSRINAAARREGLSYSRFMNGLRRAGIELDRKMLAHLAVTRPDAFAKIAERAKEAAA